MVKLVPIPFLMKPYDHYDKINDKIILAGLTLNTLHYFSNFDILGEKYR